MLRFNNKNSKQLMTKPTKENNLRNKL